MERDYVHLHMVISVKDEVSKGDGDLEKRHESAAAREIPARVAQSVLGYDKGWVRRFFASTVGINEAIIR